MKKLIPAICLLLISAMMLGTSTFAWFSMNTTVTATGMSISASAPTSLLISTISATSTFRSSAVLANDVTTPDAKFAPVAYAGACESFYKISDDAMAHINEAGRTDGGFTEIADGQPATSFTNAKVDSTKDVYVDGSKSVFHDTVWLKVEGKDNKDVICTVAYANAPATNIKDAMHVVFVVGGVVKSTIDMGGTKETTSLATLTANADGTPIDIYYFLSGNDTDCKNSSISQDDTLSITLTFSHPA